MARSFVKVAGLSAVLLALAGLTAQSAQKVEPFGALATPEGVTMQPLGLAAGYSLSKPTATKLPREQIVFANAEGLTLYTYAGDQPGKPTCVDACAEKWRPAIAPAAAQPVAGWSLIKRADGQQQWALNEKPLYTFVEDVDPGSVAGNSPKRYGRGELVGPRGSRSKSIPGDKPLPEGWSAAMMYPVGDVPTPSGISIRDVEDALALALIDNRAERTLYVFDGDVKKAEKGCATVACRKLWTPYGAPRLAAPVGDFAIAERSDGITQWTYKGRPLFTFAKDLAFNDANGMNVDPRFQVAAHKRYFLPSNVTISVTKKLGKVLATADGRTLYRRNSYIYQSGGGHGMRRGDTLRPAVGRDLGTNPRCVNECEKWKPYPAPADAQPSGDWTVYTREDGSKQWASRGHALWTYDGDVAPGDINGNDAYELRVAQGAEAVVDIGTPYDGSWALFWIAAYP
jgi:predicted lipoprotein with Yx(FWY)xxD motif